MKYIERKTYDGGTDVGVFQNEQPCPQAVIASELARHFGVIAAVPDGEDKAGRQKCRLMTEEEVVARSTKIAELLWANYQTRGWILELPTPKVPKKQDPAYLETSTEIE